MAAGMVTSMESVLDRRLEDLISKIVAGTATPADQEEIGRLTKQRSKLMYPPRMERPILPAGWRRGRVIAA